MWESIKRPSERAVVHGKVSAQTQKVLEWGTEDVERFQEATEVRNSDMGPIGQASVGRRPESWENGQKTLTNKDG